MDEWEEIKRLAADFQRTQANENLQRLSDRNCIDIVKKLTELNLIELIYTCDGKEFITPAHLLREIEDEVYVNGGRMHIHDLAAKLKIDYQHVENKAKELAKDRPDEYSLVLGQIIHSCYKITLSKQISDCMLVNGQLSIAEFAKSLDLPSEFLLSIVKDLLPRDDYVVSQDERTYYTIDMMDRCRSIVAGTLSSIIKPTTIASIMKRLDIPERIFTPIVDSLIKEGRIDAVIENRVFVPSIYARQQNEWIDKFYRSNSYIEYDVLSRMDIKQPKSFLKKRFPEGIQLKTCFISPILFSQVESLVEDSVASNGWIDISTIVPSAIESDDIQQLLQDLFKKNKQLNASCRIFNDTNVCSLGYITHCKRLFDKLMQVKVQEHLKQGKLIKHFFAGRDSETPAVQEGEKPLEEQQEIDKKDEVAVPVVDEDRSAKKERKDKKVKANPLDFEDSDEDQGGKKSRTRKSGGGTQGREIRQKAVKKKYIPGNKNSQRTIEASDEESIPLKTPRSNKGRAARRAISPERVPSSSKLTKGSQHIASPLAEEPLIFLDTDEIVKTIRLESSGSGENSDELFQSIAKVIEGELNSTYESLARETLDEFLKSQKEGENNPDKIGDIRPVVSQ